MRKWIMLVAMTAMAGCQKPGSHGGTNDTAAAGAEVADAYILSPGEWEITTVTVPRPGAPGAPETRTSTLSLSVEDALNPGPQVFGECENGALHVSGGSVQGNMPCHGEGALSRATVSVTGSYTRDRFQITTDLHFMGYTVREERRGRLVRPL
jgi:hypothetical protein